MTSIIETIRALFAQEPAGGEIWIALAWLLGILVVAYSLSPKDQLGPSASLMRPSLRCDTERSQNAATERHTPHLDTSDAPEKPPDRLSNRSYLRYRRDD